MKSAKTALLAAVGVIALLAGASAANAATATFGTYIFTQSESGLSLPFGTVTVTPLGATGAHVVENVTPNFIIDTGGPHQPLAFNLISGTITNLSPVPPFAVGAAVSASPFGSFTNSIDGAGCNPGGNGCGTSTLTFDILNFGGFASRAYTNGSTTIPIFFASDILDTTCSGTCTGNIGATSPIPLPAALPLFVAGLGMLGWLGASRRRIALRT